MPEAPLTLPVYCPNRERPLTLSYRPAEDDQQTVWACPHENCRTVHTLNMRARNVKASVRYLSDPRPGRDHALTVQNLTDLLAIIERRVACVLRDGPPEALPGLEAIRAEIAESLRTMTVDQLVVTSPARDA